MTNDEFDDIRETLAGLYTAKAADAILDQEIRAAREADEDDGARLDPHAILDRYDLLDLAEAVDEFGVSPDDALAGRPYADDPRSLGSCVAGYG
jgi:hypothetical protein